MTEFRGEHEHAHPLVSVVLPTFNGARYLAESLDSVLAQTYAHWELIVVDDASTDETPAIVARYAARDTRVRSIRHETNRRLPGALNTGFAAARGELLTWTSDDNRYRARALEVMVAVLSEMPRVDFVYADYDIIDDAGVTTDHVQAQEPLRLLYGEATVPCFLYRRCVYDQLGGYAENLFLAEDYDFWLRVLLSAHRMTTLHQTLYAYRRHPRSLTDRYRGRTFAAAEGALLRNLPRIVATRPTVQGQVYLTLASLAWWRRDLPYALRYTMQAVRYAPRQTAGKTLAFIKKRLRHQRSSR